MNRVNPIMNKKSVARARQMFDKIRNPEANENFRSAAHGCYGEKSYICERQSRLFHIIEK